MTAIVTFRAELVAWVGTADGYNQVFFTGPSQFALLEIPADIDDAKTMAPCFEEAAKLAESGRFERVLLMKRALP